MKLHNLIPIGGLAIGAYLVYKKLKSSAYLYNISTDGVNTYATNNITGTIDYTGTDASSIINSVTPKGNVFITEGTYKIKTPITVYSGFALDGQGFNTVLQADIGCPQLIQQNGYIDVDPFGTSASNVTIRNIHFDGNNIADRCIQAKIDNCLVENCIFEKAKGFAVKIVRSNSPIIHNNTVLSSGADCLHLLYCTNGLVTGNNVSGKNDDGIAIVLSHNTMVTRNYVNGENSEAGSCYANWGGSDNTFSENIGENEPVRHGINIVDYLGDYPSRINVINNIFRNNGWAGVYIVGTSGTNSITSVNVIGNKIHNNNKYGVYILRAGYGTVKNNVLTDNCGSLSSTYEQILVDFYGIEYSTHWNIDSNIISSSLSNQPLYTIYIASTEPSHTTISNNILSDAVSRILQVNDPQANVFGNKICSVIR